ncbi:hypothetical protein A9Q84_17915 [Halobacteriovorax marinus]|uniref:Solute-binding protein family 3/N-terminal domain-containing protein n=1 Tax=Halobacteriovorax marinus TaxID=97084 RepID=A0A1Y5F785_9BACT|nr:hypothetical protein A9Q84_17915 [Halobacteriovorax marinus]
MTPAWNGLTNSDGTGLYHEIIKEIFKTQGLKVKILIQPFKRCLKEVKVGTADLAGGVMPESYSKKFLYAKKPIYVDDIGTLFHKSLLPTWNKIKTIKENLDTTVGPIYLGETIEAGLKFTELKTRKQCLEFLIKKRAKYLVDASNILENILKEKSTTDQNSSLGFEESKMKKTKKTKTLEFNKSDYVIKKLVYRRFHMLFTNNQRGKLIKKSFDQGMKELIKRKSLSKLYKKWKFSKNMPRF